MNEKERVREFKSEEKICIARNIPVKLMNDGSFKELLDKYALQYKELMHKRGDYIDMCLDIEGDLDAFICLFLFGKDYKKSDLFRELVLEAEFFTFFQKKKMVERIIMKNLNLFPNLTADRAESIIQSIWNIINDRNKMAHGRIVIDVGNEKPMLEYYENGRREIELNSKFFEKFENRIGFVDKELRSLIKELRDKPTVSSYES